MVSRQAIDDAIVAHGHWRRRLEEAIGSGKSAMRPAVVRHDDACELGQWLRSLDDRERKDGHFDKVSALHVEFHETAADIFELALRGARGEAARRMEFGNAYTLISGKLVLALNAWKNSLP
jgi:hypothetical protein